MVGGPYLGQVLPGRLDADGGAVAAGVAVHAAHHRRDGRLLPVAGGGVRDVRPQEDDWLLEHRGPGGGGGDREGGGEPMRSFYLLSLLALS